MELEKAIKKLKTLNQERYNQDTILSLYRNFIDEDEENQPYILTPFERDAIEVVLNHLTKQEKIIDELKNVVHYQKCINCGKEIRVKRTDAKYCEECAKSKRKDYFKNMSDEKKKERAEKSKIYMRELRARRKEDRE